MVVIRHFVDDTVGDESGPVAIDDRLQRAQDFVRERGAPAVFLGRFVAFFRATVPGLAGMSGMPYRRFVAWNAPPILRSAIKGSLTTKCLRL